MNKTPKSLISYIFLTLVLCLVVISTFATKVEATNGSTLSTLSLPSNTNPSLNNISASASDEIQYLIPKFRDPLYFNIQTSEVSDSELTIFLSNDSYRAYFGAVVRTINHGLNVQTSQIENELMIHIVNDISSGIFDWFGTMLLGPFAELGIDQNTLSLLLGTLDIYKEYEGARSLYGLFAETLSDYNKRALLWFYIQERMTMIPKEQAYSDTIGDYYYEDVVKLVTQLNGYTREEFGAYCEDAYQAYKLANDQEAREAYKTFVLHVMQVYRDYQNESYVWIFATSSNSIFVFNDGPIAINQVKVWKNGLFGPSEIGNADQIEKESHTIIQTTVPESKIEYITFNVLNLTIINNYNNINVPVMVRFHPTLLDSEDYPPALWQFDARSTAFTPGYEIMEYEWNYGDGHTENGSNLNIVTHNYSNVGSYDVTLTIILNDNSHWSCSYGITIMNPIRATITQNYTSGRSGITSFIFDGSQSVDVIPNSTLIYSWDLGDGTSATGAIIQGHIYQSEGSYRVTLTVSDSLGSGLSDAAQIVIYVGEDNTWIPLSGIYDCNTHLTTVFTGYIVSGTATISEGYTLTIDPGVIVKFMSNASINIDGTLIAQGTAASSIIFTSLKDDTAGGDTNQDGNTTPAAGDWGGINFGSTSSNDILDHVLVRYAINTVGITIVNPNQGSKGQTLNVTITGTSFIGATAVSFGDGIITNNFSVDGATQITANISIDAMTYLGARDVCIITPGGTGNLPNGFTVSQISKLCVSSYLSPVIAGVAVDFTVTAQDASGNTITNYVGTIHFTSSDPQAALPANYTFISGDNGTHTFNATLKTAGSQFITAIDVVTNTITGTQNSISVNPAFASQIRVETTTNGSGNIVSAQSVTVGSSITVYSVTRDQYGNFIANAVGTWSLANKTGTVADSDLVPAGDNKSAVFTGHSTGTTAIQILSTGLISTDSGLLTVLSTQVITPSNDATLSSLTISSGTLSPAFTSGTHDYTDNVADTVTSVTVTPTVAESHATVTVNGNAVTSSSASPSINLSAGSNIITIVVTAQDGSTRVIYTVTVIVTTTTTIHSGGASVVQSGAGVSTTISGSSAADGTNVTVASVDYGNNQPTGTGNVQLNGTEYYDVNVSSSTSLGAGAMARVSITSPSVTATSTMQYWYSGVWNTAGNISVNVGLISGDIPVAALGGTPVVIGTSSTGLPSTHVWHLDSTGHPVMEKTGTQSGSVDIAAGSSAIWLSDQAAAADVTFASGIWTIKLATTSDWSSTCSAQIGYFNTAGNGAFTAFNATAVSGTYSGGIITITITTGGDVSKNDYLALKIINGSGSSHSITTDGSSSLTAPSGSPNFPTPETPTVVLLGIGLVCLSGFLFVRRKKAIRGNIGQ